MVKCYNYILQLVQTKWKVLASGGSGDGETEVSTYANSTPFNNDKTIINSYAFIKDKLKRDYPH